MAFTIPAKRPRTKALTFKAERDPHPTWLIRAARGLLGLGALFGLAAAGLGGYLIWDLAPHLSAGRGGMYAIGAYLMIAGALQLAAPAVHFRRRRRAGRGLRPALGLACAGAVWLGWTSVPMLYGAALDTGLRGSPTVWAGVVVLGLLLLLGFGVVLTLVLGRRKLARLPARPTQRRTVLHRYVGARRLLWFAPLAAAGSIALLVATPSPSSESAIAEQARELRRPAGREARLAAMVSEGAASAPVIVEWLAGSEEPGVERRDLVLDVVHEFTGGTEPIPILAAIFGDRFALDRPRHWTDIGVIALERIAAREPRILESLRSLLLSAEDLPREVMAHALVAHGPGGVEVLADVIERRDRRAWNHTALLIRIAELNHALRTDVANALCRGTGSEHTAVRSASYRYLPSVAPACGPWLRAGLDDPHLYTAEMAAYGFLELPSISGEDEARLHAALEDRDRAIAELALAALVQHRPSDRSLDERVREFWGEDRWYGASESRVLLAITRAGPAARRHLAHARTRFATALPQREFLTASAAVGGPEAIRDLQRAAGGGRRFPFAAAFGELVRWSPSDARTLTESLLTDPRAVVRVLALEAALEHGVARPEDLGILPALFSDEDEQVRFLAMIAARRAEVLPGVAVQSLREIAVRGADWERLRARVLLAVHAGEEAQALEAAREFIRRPTEYCGPSWTFGVATRIGPAARLLAGEKPEIPTRESVPEPRRWWLASRIAEGDGRVREGIGDLDWFW